MRKFLSVFLLMVLFLIPGYALATFIDIDITTLTDEELTALLEEANALATSIRNEQNARDYERAVASLGDASIDPLLKSYEGVYQRYSTFRNSFEDDDFFVIKDGVLYDYSFTFEKEGRASLTELTLVSYDAPNNIGTIYCDREQITQYASGQNWYVYNGGIKLDTMDNGQKCIVEYELRNKKWKRMYDNYWFLPVNNVTKEELDARYYATIGKPDPAIGMTAEEVLNSKWGSPKKKNRTVTSYGIEEQWVYDGTFTEGYIYLSNGIVTGIQY